MKGFKPIAIIVTTMIASGEGVALPSLDGWYVGVDYKHQKMESRNKGLIELKDRTKKAYHGFDIYLGAPFAQSLGMELGYHQGLSRSKDTTFEQNAVFGTNPQNLNDRLLLKVQTRSFHIDMNAYMPLMANFDAMSQVGLALMKARVRADFIPNGGTAQDLEVNSKLSLVGRLGIGVRYRLTDLLNIRLLGRWESTNKLSIQIYDDDGDAFKVKPFKSGVSVALGLFAYL